MNTRNYAIAEGRLTKNVAIRTNSDGSRKAMFTLAVQRNYVNKDGKRASDFLPMEGFIPASKENNGVYDCMHEGDLVSVLYTVRSDWYEKDGESVFKTTLQVEQIELRESKKVTEARAEKKAAKAANDTPADAPMPAPEAAEDDGVPFSE